MERSAGPRARARAEALRALPSVERIASALGEMPHSVAVRTARAVIEDARQAILAGGEPPHDLEDAARERAVAAQRASLRPVLNATGVIVHTNLVRAPLAEEAARAAVDAAGYSNLEYELDS